MVHVVGWGIWSIARYRVARHMVPYGAARLQAAGHVVRWGVGGLGLVLWCGAWCGVGTWGFYGVVWVGAGIQTGAAPCRPVRCGAVLCSVLWGAMGYYGVHMACYMACYGVRACFGVLYSVTRRCICGTEWSGGVAHARGGAAYVALHCLRSSGHSMKGL